MFYSQGQQKVILCLNYLKSLNPMSKIYFNCVQNLFCQNSYGHFLVSRYFLKAVQSSNHPCHRCDPMWSHFTQSSVLWMIYKPGKPAGPIPISLPLKVPNAELYNLWLNLLCLSTEVRSRTRSKSTGAQGEFKTCHQPFHISSGCQ